MDLRDNLEITADVEVGYSHEFARGFAASKRAERGRRVYRRLKVKHARCARKGIIAKIDIIANFREISTSLIPAGIRIHRAHGALRGRALGELGQAPMLPVG
jgi:hypothetical protein